MMEIPKLKLLSYNYKHRKYVKCPKCSFWSDRYDKDGKDNLKTLCPYCRVKANLKKMEIRNNA